MKTLLLALTLLLSVNTVRADEPLYTCQVKIEGPVISIMVYDNQTWEAVYTDSTDCSGEVDVNYCKYTTIDYFSKRAADWRANGFCY